MPPIETIDRNQTAVLWMKAGVDNYNNPAVNAPREIEVRWVWTTRKMVSPTGDPIMIDATIVVDEDIRAGSILYLGTIEDALGTGSDFLGKTTDLCEVVGIKTTEDIRGGETRRTLSVQRYNKTLPAIAG